MRSFDVRIAQYEGPLDLLLSLVRSNDLSIADISLAPITAQYLAYIEEAESLDMNLGMEWIEMAARLIHWKSTSLLPTDPALPDPATALAQELNRELKSLSEAQLAQGKEILAERGAANQSTWTQSTQDHQAVEEELSATLWTLRKKAEVLQNIFRSRRILEANAYELATGQVTVQDMMEWTLERLALAPASSPISVELWFTELPTISHQVCLFLSLLELAKQGPLWIEESIDAFFLVRLRSMKGFG